MVDTNISQHFRADEREFINQMLDMIVMVKGQYRPVLSDFLNPRQVFIAKTLINREDDVQEQTWGGYPNAEMQRMLLYPDYFTPDHHDFKIRLMDIKYPVKFAELHHRQILGTLLGSGIQRHSFGDILNQGTSWQLLISDEMTRFVTRQIDRVGKVRAQFQPIDGEQVLTPESDWEPVRTTVPSLRLDAVIANVFNYSRNRAKETIQHGLVRVNWETVERPDYQLAEQDLVSVRHGGRIQLTQTNGRNKKNNIRLEIQLIKA